MGICSGIWGTHRGIAVAIVVCGSRAEKFIHLIKFRA